VTSKKFYPLQRQGNLLWVRAAVGSNDGSAIVVRLLVDTGSSFTVLPTRVVEALGCNLLQPLRIIATVGASGTINAPMVAVPWLNCLGQRIESFSVVAYTIPAAAFVDGLLGMDFLSSCKAIITIANAEIRFGD
jgi:aspartyl protease family protein